MSDQDGSEDILQLLMQHQALARTQLDRGDGGKAIEAYDKARQTVETLIAKQPDDPFPKFVLAGLYEEIAAAHQQLKNDHATVEAYGQALNLAAEVAASRADNQDWCANVTGIALDDAQALAKQNRTGPAIEVLHKALDALERCPRSNSYFGAVAQLHFAVADYHRQRDEPRLAAAVCQAAIVPLTALVESGEAKWAKELLNASGSAFDTWIALGECKSAAETLAAACLSKAAPGRHWRDRFGRLALAQMAQKSWSDALDSLERAASFCSGSDKDSMHELATFKSQAALVHLLQGDVAAARTLANQIAVLCRFKSWFSQTLKQDLMAAQFILKCCEEDAEKRARTAGEIVAALVREYPSAAQGANQPDAFLGEAAKPRPRKRKTAISTDFMVTAPPVAPAGQTFHVELWVGPSDNNDAMRREALRSGDQQPAGQRFGAMIDQCCVLRASLSLPGFHIEQPMKDLSWTGQITNTAFLVTALDGTPPGKKSGVITIMVEGLALAEVTFAVDLGRAATKVPNEETATDIRRIQRAFASYAADNLDEVLRCVQGMQAVGVNVFMDLLNLQPGEQWEPKLYSEIGRSDAFFLFWSLEASRSEYVKKEWQFALEHRGLKFIQPVPLVDPHKVPPPPELNSTHFNDWFVAYFELSRARARN